MAWNRKKAPIIKKAVEGEMSCACREPLCVRLFKTIEYLSYLPAKYKHKQTKANLNRRSNQN